MSDTRVDPATVEVVRNYLTSAANEMMWTLMRSATDTAIYEIRDFGISLYDANVDLVADSPGVIAFLGTNDFAIEAGIESIGKENFEPGDVVVMNYPYVTGMHTHDVLLFSPFFLNDEIIGYGVSRGHWVDIGAKDPAYTLDSTDIHQEGLLFPPIRVYKGGDPDEEILDLIRLNSRMPNTVIGELKAQVASLRTGNDRLQALHKKYGTGTIDACVSDIIDHGKQSARQAVRELPNGTWSAVDYGDGPNDDGGLVRLKATVTIDGDSFVVDYSGSDGPVSMPFNAAEGLSRAVAALCLKVVTTPTANTNKGQFDPLEVVVPKDSVLDAQYPSSTFVHWYCGVLIDVVLKALSKGMPKRVPSSSSSDIPNIRVFGEDPDTGRKFVEMANTGQGWGATESHDGASGMSPLVEPLHESNPVEVAENKAPVVMVEQLELRQDSGGVGEYRGGLGVSRDYRFIASGNALTIRQKTCTENWGVDGGEPGTKGVVMIESDDEDLEDRISAYVDNDSLYEDTTSKKWTGLMRGSFEPGELVSNRAGGGGGFGDPFERDPEAVLEDVIDEYVSREAAWREYGVSITSNLEIDWEETRERQSD